MAKNHVLVAKNANLAILSLFTGDTTKINYAVEVFSAEICPSFIGTFWGLTKQCNLKLGKSITSK